VVVYVVASVVLSGQGLDGQRFLGHLWFWATASSGAGQWALAQYPAPHATLPQYLDKEGGALWFSMAPHQLAHADPIKYTRFLQHRFSLTTLLDNQVDTKITSLEDYGNVIPEKEAVSAYEADNLGFTQYLNIFSHMNNWACSGDDCSPRIEAIYRPALKDTWKEDVEFARQQTTGANPMSIHWAKDGKLPDALNLSPKVTAQLDAVSQEGMKMNVTDLSSAGRLFYSDYAIMREESIRRSKGRYVYPAIAVFYADNEGLLQPLAIQLTRNGDDRVYTPLEENPEAWLFAKMHTMSADGLYHQMAVHLLQCHLSMEPIIISANKHLNTSGGCEQTSIGTYDLGTYDGCEPGHPVGDLLAPHFHRTIAINSFGRYTMLGGGTEENPPIFDQITSIGVNGTLDLMMHAYTDEWSLTDNSFPRHLERRGFTREEPSMLKDFPYKEDGFLIWDAITAYVKDCLDQHYDQTTGVTVAGDTALQAWLTEMRTPQKDGGAEVHGVPEVRDKSALTQVLAAIIFQATAQHSAVNFGQWEYYSMVPNRPLTLWKPMPEDPSEVTMEYILSSLPNLNDVHGMLGTARALTLPTAFPLLAPKRWEEGQSPFGHGRFSYNMRFPEAFKKFEATLAQVETEVKARNEKRRWPYTFLQPSEIPSSIAV